MTPALARTNTRNLGSPVEPATSIGPADLADLMGTFNEVTSKLEATHQALRSEVTRLSTELTETKQQLHRAQELAALGEMAAGIAHEVRNPLGPIRLFAEALVQDLSDRPEQQGIASRIVTSVTRLNAVVTDVLNFSRELRLDPTDQPLSDIVRESTLSALAIAADHDIKIDIDAAVLDSFQVIADDALLTQALSNVVRNACEAAAETPATRARRVSVTASPAMVRTDSNTRRDAVAITVTDTGTGIPEDVKKRIFNPFFTTRETGTGLGLPIVHRIIDAHEGRIEIQNIEDSEGRVQGARISLVVPAPSTSSPAPRQELRIDHPEESP